MTRADTSSPCASQILAAAIIRAWICAERGLSESQGCNPPGCPVCGDDDAPACEHCVEPVAPCVCTDGGNCGAGGYCEACPARTEVAA